MKSQLGMALGIAAYFFFSLHDATNKWLVASVPVWQILFFRSMFIVVVCIGVGRFRLVEDALASPMKRPIMLRAVLTLTAWLCYYSAAKYLPLAQLLTLYFSSPLLTTALAAPLLGEKVTRLHWISVCVGFGGVVAASDPFGTAAWSARLFPTLLVLVAAALWGYAVILMRQIARKERSLLQIMLTNVVICLVTGTMTAFSWVPLSWPQTGLVLCVGVLGGTGQFLMFEAARRAQASVMATVEYSALLWAFVLGYLIWHDIPTPAVWLGAGLIVLAGGVLVIGERRGARAALEQT